MTEEKLQKAYQLNQKIEDINLKIQQKNYLDMHLGRLVNSDFKNEINKKIRNYLIKEKEEVEKEFNEL
jgi:hypothetical protein